MSKGRPPKAQPGDVVYWSEWKPVHPKGVWQVAHLVGDKRAPAHWSGMPQIRTLQYGVVTAYKRTPHPGVVGWVGYYQVVRITNPVSGQTYGQSVWKRSDMITKYEDRTFVNGLLNLRANEKLGGWRERGCSCNCCAHVAIPRGQILPDGTLRGDRDD